MQLVGSRPGYDTAFYDLQRDESLRTAHAVVPVVRDLTHPTSVVDVGCGVGTWLAAWRECGVLDVHGIDGSYVDRDMLLIPAEQFQPHDLTTPINLERRFELAMSLEVAEHLPRQHAGAFVRTLCRLAPLVLFSAAIPAQPGVHHVNCQWPWYWHHLFRAEGYVVLDAIRPRIWQDQRVAPWYRQNIFLMAERERWASDATLRHIPVVDHSEPMVLISGSNLIANLGLRASLRRLPVLFAEGVGRMLSRRPRRYPWEAHHD